MEKQLRKLAPVALLSALPSAALTAETAGRMDLTGNWVGLFAIAVFVPAYLLVMAEEFTHLRKSKPVIIAAGVGGSLLSIGSAAGVALMGQARGKYTFFGHLKWARAIAVAYVASMLVHMLVNRRYLSGG